MLSAPSLVLPTAVGRAALADLPRIPWAELFHAHGKGNVGPALHEDVSASLAMLGDHGREPFQDALSALFSSVCQVGVIYEATAYAVPFLAALIADPKLPGRRARGISLLLGSIALAASTQAEDPSRAGSFRFGVPERTRKAFLLSDALLRAAEVAHPPLRRLVVAIAELTAAEAPTDEDRARVGDLFELLENEDAYDDADEDEDEDEDEDDEDDDDARAPAVSLPIARVRHSKFGEGSVVERDGEKARVRFDDGVERLLLERFLTLLSPSG